MNDSTNFRTERIEKLLNELRYEVSRGMMEREIEETISFSFIIPISRALPDGVVQCMFETRPVPRYAMIGMDPTPRLRIVK